MKLFEHALVDENSRVLRPLAFEFIRPDEARSKDLTVTLGQRSNGHTAANQKLLVEEQPALCMHEFEDLRVEPADRRKILPVFQWKPKNAEVGKVDEVLPRQPREGRLKAVRLDSFCNDSDAPRDVVRRLRVYFLFESEDVDVDD